MKFANFRLAPFMLIFLVAGIVSASFSFNNFYALLSIGVIATGIPVLFIKSKYLNISRIASIFVIMGLFTTTLTLYMAVPSQYDNSLIQGRITEDIQYNQDDTIEFYIDNIRIDDKKVRGKAYLQIDSEILYGNELHIGDQLTFYGSIKREALNPRDSFSVRNYKNQEYYIASIDSIELREKGRIRIDERIRIRIYDSLTSAIDNPDSAGMAYALLTGQRDKISYNTRLNISTSGIAHIFAVSGMHIGILSGFIYLCLRKAKISRYLKLLLASIVLIFYGYICGFPPSVVRAILMSIMVMYGSFSGRRNDMLSIVSISAVMILIVKPISLFDLSFLMSYGAVFGIILMYKPIDRIFHKLPKIIAPLVITSLSTNIALFPIMTTYFNSFSVYFLLANLIILPIISVVYIVLLISSILALILPFMSFLLTMCGWVFSFIQLIAKYISSLPLAVISIGSLGVFSIFYYANIIICSDYILLDKKYTNKLLLISCIGLAIGLVIALISV